MQISARIKHLVMVCSFSITVSTQALASGLQSEDAEQQLQITHLKSMIARQEKELASLEKQRQDTLQTRSFLSAHNYQLLAALEKWQATDKPFLVSERQLKLSELRAMLDDPAASNALKYQRLVQTLLAEFEYGQSVLRFEDIAVIKGESMYVDMLMIGRAVYLARTPDLKRYWTWDVALQSWVEVQEQDLPAIRQAYINSASPQQSALLRLPVSLRASTQELSQ